MMRRVLVLCALLALASCAAARVPPQPVEPEAQGVPAGIVPLTTEQDDQISRQ